MEKIPDDILPNIFIRLPAKQLAQMRCLCKSWNAFLSKSSFIKSHLHLSIQNQNNNNDGILLVFPTLFSFASKPFTARPSRSPHLELPNFIKLPVNPQSENRHGKVIRFVNGLICFRYRSDHHSKLLYRSICDSAFIYRSNQEPEVIYICNPSLSALLTLPPYYMPSHSIQQIFRFGFDPKTDDYKVVRIRRHILTLLNTVICMEWLPVEIYSMRKGSWKLITQTIPSCVSDLSDCDKLCVDGHDGYLHWNGYIYRGNRGQNYNKTNIIVAFDLDAETFREIPLPDSVTGDNAKDVLINVGVLYGKFFVISKAFPDDKFVVWVMDDNESWVKHHVFPMISRYVYPDEFASYNEFLLHVFHRVLGCDRALYNLAAAKTKIFKLGGNNDRFKIVDYVDSLVWVTPVEQRERSCCSISQFQS